MKTKLFLFITFAAVVITGSVSCSKDDEDDDPVTRLVPDLWIGTYTVDQLPAQQPSSYILSIKPNGTITTESTAAGNVYYSVGNWTLTNDTLRCNFTSLNFSPGPQVSQSAKFFYDKSTGKLLNGTWKDETNGSNFTGKFPVMDRVN